MPIVNTAGKMVKMEGGDIATVALMAAFLMAGNAQLDEMETAEQAVVLYTNVVERVHAFNLSHIRAAVKGAGPHEQ